MLQRGEFKVTLGASDSDHAETHAFKKADDFLGKLR